MELLFETTSPDTLKADIIKMIKDDKLNTWSIYKNDDKEYLKHTHQWGEKGVILLTADQQKKLLHVKVYKFKNTNESVESFEGYYLGRFCELVFVHFAQKFTSIQKK